MAGLGRTVRRVRVRAPSEASGRRVVRLLEDALRTASLPDLGGRMLFVRRLALGAVRPDAAAQTVALALERAVARADVRWVHGLDPAAGEAPAVWLRDPLEAHVALTIGVLRGRPPLAWFWPRAVPGWEPSLGREEAVGVIGRSLAGLPEAAVALPRWCAEVVAAGLGGELEASLHEADLPLLASAAGVRLEGVGGSRDRTGGAMPPAALASSVRVLVRELLRRASPLAGPDPLGGDVVRGESPRESSLAPAPAEASGLPNPTSGDAARAGRGASGGDPAGGRVRGRGLPAANPMVKAAEPEPRRGLVRQGATNRGSRDSYPPAVPGSPDSALDSWGVPTASGGVLFLLQGLTRIGYGDWLDAQPEWTEQDVARAVLARVLGRQRVARADPAWWLTRPQALPGPIPPRFVAPAPWRERLAAGRGPLRCATAGDEGRLHDPSGRLLLAAWRGRRPRAVLAAIRAAAPFPAPSATPAPPPREAVIEAWDVALRRWLRRFAGLSAAAVVRRPGRLSLTPTHVDLYLDLASADPAIRRAGLDVDPGWIPWFGRVVSFHFLAGQRP